jgi:hypothetical protein
MSGKAARGIRQRSRHIGLAHGGIRGPIAFTQAVDWPQAQLSLAIALK